MKKIFLFITFFIVSSNYAIYLTDNTFAISANVGYLLGNDLSENATNVKAHFIRDGITEVSVDVDSVTGYFSLNPTVVETNEILAPSDESIGNNYPNPFTNQTRIPINIDSKGVLEIYNSLGQVINQTVIEGPGQHDVIFDGGDAEGMYFAKLITEKGIYTENLVFVGGNGNNNMSVESQQFSQAPSTGGFDGSNMFKSATLGEYVDIVLIEGDNISSTYFQVSHNQDNQDMGALGVNVPPRVESEMEEQNVLATSDVIDFNYDLSQHIYNDSETDYVVRNPNSNIIVENGILKYNLAESDSTWIDLFDVMDPDLP